MLPVVLDVHISVPNPLFQLGTHFNRARQNIPLCSLSFSQFLLMALALAGADLLSTISQGGRARLHIQRGEGMIHILNLKSLMLPGLNTTVPSSQKVSFWSWETGSERLFDPHGSEVQSFQVPFSSQPSPQSFPFAWCWSSVLSLPAQGES